MAISGLNSKSQSLSSNQIQNRSGNIYNFLDKGLNKIRFVKDNLIKICLAIFVAVVLFSASSCATPTNQQPIITSLEAETEWSVPLGSLQVACTASDPDGDELSYDWSANAGELIGAGDTVTWVAPTSEGCYNVAVAVTDGRGGEVMDHVAITVRTNNAPTIAGLIADMDWTAPAGSLRVTCTASDPDTDEITYEWAAAAGDISGTGAVINWTAPQEVGTYDITVVVRDGHGWEDTRSVSLSVAFGPPLTIENLVVTAKGHIYLIEIIPGYKYKVLRTAEYYIECIASDTNGGLFHEWSCDGGQITGGDSMITWTAPNTDIEVTVTVTVVVSDGVGNRVNRNLVFQVITCACGF